MGEDSCGKGHCRVERLLTGVIDRGDGRGEESLKALTEKRERERSEASRLTLDKKK